MHDTLDSRYFPYEGSYWNIKGGYSFIELAPVDAQRQDVAQLAFAPSLSPGAASSPPD